LDPNVAAACSPVAEPESDEGEGPDYEDYYRDMDDKFSDEEGENDGAREDAHVHKKQREQADFSAADDGAIVVDLEEVLSPEEFEALYAQIPNSVNDSMDAQQPGGFGDDAVDQQEEAEIVVKDAEELVDINPEDMELFMGQGFPP
jgi:hypothetical protein